MVSKFDNPGLSERILYCKYWQRKLRGSKFINYPKSLIEKIAGLTADFSFAYTKEAVWVATVTIWLGTELTIVKRVNSYDHSWRPS